MNQRNASDPLLATISTPRHAACSTRKPHSIDCTLKYCALELRTCLNTAFRSGDLRIVILSEAKNPRISSLSVSSLCASPVVFKQVLGLVRIWKDFPASPVGRNPPERNPAPPPHPDGNQVTANRWFPETNHARMLLRNRKKRCSQILHRKGTMPMLRNKKSYSR